MMNSATTNTVGPRPKRPRRRHHPRGISVIFAIVMVTVMLLTAVTMTVSFFRAADRNHDLFRSIQAYYAGRASMEKAIALVSAEDVGYEESDPTAISVDTVGGTDDDVFGEYEIFARAKPLDWREGGPVDCNFPDYCQVPIPGSGNTNFGGIASGSEYECDFTDSGQAWAGDSDDECNWNRISYQETVTIPLYYDDAAGAGGIQNPADTGLAEVTLRIRTPYDEDQGLRPDLHTDLEEEFVVHWEFSATCNEGGSDFKCYLVGRYKNAFSDTRIDGGMVNSANSSGDYEMWNGTSDGTDERGVEGGGDSVDIIDFLLADSGEYTSRTIEKIVLKLTVVSPLMDGFDDSIPYLEYQLQVDQPISDNKVLYTSIGKADGRQGSYIQKLKASQSIGSSVIVSFVLQN